jgi:cytochrome P450
MLLAGEDTTANTLAWMMHFMVERPDVQARMREEVDRVLGPARRIPDYATADAMPYIEAVAHEAMRLEPVAPFLVMEANRDCVIGEVAMPAGTSLFLLLAYVASRPRSFAEAAAFRPERWLQPGAGEHNTKAFMPFGSGPRYCPGRHLAMLEIKLIAAMLVRNFEFVRTPGSPPTREQLSFTLAPKDLSVTLGARAD